MLAINTIIKKELLDHIRDNNTQKEEWETYVELFLKKKKGRSKLQLDNEILSNTQQEMIVNQ